MNDYLTSCIARPEIERPIDLERSGRRTTTARSDTDVELRFADVIIPESLIARQLRETPTGPERAVRIWLQLRCDRRPHAKRGQCQCRPGRTSDLARVARQNPSQVEAAPLLIVYCGSNLRSYEPRTRRHLPVVVESAAHPLILQRCDWDAVATAGLERRSVAFASIIITIFSF